MGNLPDSYPSEEQAAQQAEQPFCDFSELNKLLEEHKRQREEQERHLRAKLQLQEDFGELRASYRWFAWKRLLIYLPGTLVAFALAGFLSLILIGSDIGPVLIIIIITLGFFGLSLWGMYHILTVSLNYTTIEITSDTLCVRHGPLPYPGNRLLQCSDLKEVRTERLVKKGIPILWPLGLTMAFEMGDIDALTPKASFYRIRAILKDGREFNLLYGTDDQAIHYLQAAIVKRLSLRDGGS